MNYYGDKISENMTVTPEGYLVCQNVPIGRTGWMRYFGQEIPAAFGEPMGTIVQVYRSPEELFSPETIASFEGKPVTNTHPHTNLDINTAPMTERGHVQNVRREGDFLVADLHVKDAGLVSEVQNKLKREVSSGYDCSWHKIGEGQYEQREIIGNHVAVVPNGRAGPKVAIHDSDPGEEPSEKPETGGKKKMKITQKMLAAIGFKQFAQDADPEDIAKAMDALQEGDEPKKEPVKDEKSEPEKKDEPGEKKDAQDAIPAWAQALMTEVQSLRAEVKDAKSDDDKETAESVMDATEEELEKEAKDEDPEKEEKKEPAKDANPAPMPPAQSAADAAPLKKFVQDMKPIIMAIPDEKQRLEAAKKLRATVQDARSYSRGNGYADIQGAVFNNRKTAMDGQSAQRQSVAEQNVTACSAWKAAGDKMKGVQ